MRFLFCSFLILLAPFARAQEADIEIDLDLAAQKATLYQDGEPIYSSAISSGRQGHPTPVGDFEVIEKDPNHKSTLYGKILDGRGHVVKSSADIATPVPKGCHFEQAPMKWFLRFDGAAGMHAGILPGYAASHGCVRMPAEKAKLFYDIAQLGTPVHVHGAPPYRSEEEETRPRAHEERPIVVVAPPPPAPSKKPFFLRLF
jgi:lipoprotein-anchoring transpeptidase ErfK/SrfK